MDPTQLAILLFDHRIQTLNLFLERLHFILIEMNGLILFSIVAFIIKARMKDIFIRLQLGILLLNLHKPLMHVIQRLLLKANLLIQSLNGLNQSLILSD